MEQSREWSVQNSLIFVNIGSTIAKKIQFQILYPLHIMDDHVSNSIFS